MSFDNFQQRKQKWEGKQDDLKVNSARPAMHAAFSLTLRNVLELLGGKRGGKLLDIGCGFGEIDILLAQNTDFEIIGFDFARKAVDIAKANVKKAGLESRIKIGEGDVYQLNYPDNFFDAVVSFGYVSAATFPGAQKEIARILKPGGILICDFINCLSFYKILLTLKRFLRGQKIPYYVTLAGIKHEFTKGGFVFLDQRFFNTFPPLNLKINPGFYLAFEDSCGKIFRNFLGRVRLVSFQKPF